MKKNMIIAITGQSGSGKSSLSNFYKEKGYTVIDCDKVASDIHKNEECQKQLCDYFGEDIITEGIIDKTLLAQKAFSSAENLEKLTEITHPFIIQELLKTANDCFENGENLVFVDGAVIIGHSFEEYCHKFILVLCDKNLQYNRLIERDNITLEQAKNRISKQTNLETLISKSDFVVYNNETIKELENQGEYVLRTLENL